MKHLLFCLFPSFKERVLLPVEVIVRLPKRPVFLAFSSRSCNWECKGKQKFLTNKQMMKIFFLRLAVLAASGPRLGRFGVQKCSMLSISKLYSQLSLGRFARGFEAMNPVDSWRGAKVRGFLKEPRPAATFFFAGRGAQLRSIWECKNTGRFLENKRQGNNIGVQLS